MSSEIVSKVRHRARDQLVERRGPHRRAPDGHDGVFSPATRRLGVAYLLVTWPVAHLIGSQVHDERGYLSAWAMMSGLLSFPATGASLVAANRCRSRAERVFWRGWSVAMIVSIANGLGLYAVAETDAPTLKALAAPAVAVNALLFIAANLWFMRCRSGRRSLLLDVVETATAVMLLVTFFIVVFGEQMADSPAHWFTISCAEAGVGGIIGLVWAITLHQRAPAGHRLLERLAVALALMTVIDASAQFAQGLSGFTLPAGPLLLVQQATMGALLLVPLHARRVPTPGLERLSPQHQARGSRTLTALTLVAVPALGALALSRREVAPWTVVSVMTQVSAVAMLLALRTLLALNETKRLYREVADGAEERQRLLSALARRADDDRHRVAAQLHQQAISSYATFASFIETASARSDAGIDALPETSQSLRDELGRQAEVWRSFMLAVRPPDGEAASAQSLATSIRAHIVGLFDEQPTPMLRVEVDPALQLDWVTEALVLRIVQELVTDIRCRSHAEVLDVALRATGSGLEMHVVHDLPGADITDTGLAAVSPFVALANGEVHVERLPGGLRGMVVQLGHLGTLAPRHPGEPRLRIVSDRS